MRVQFQIVDSRHARWHGKVAQAAAERVGALVQGFACELAETLAAETAPNEDSQVTVCRRHIEERMIVSVIFAAATWTTVASSIGDATEQLASAILHIVPPARVPELRTLFVGAGVSALRHVREASLVAPRDPRAHFALHFTAPGFQMPDLSRLYDELDLMLQRERSGEVDGSGAGIGGYHLDVSLHDRAAGIRSIFQFLSEQRLRDYVRVVDLDTGQQLYDSEPVA